jgi:hypothetical protein
MVCFSTFSFGGKLNVVKSFSFRNQKEIFPLLQNKKQIKKMHEGTKKESDLVTGRPGTKKCFLYKKVIFLNQIFGPKLIL